MQATEWHITPSPRRALVAARRMVAPRILALATQGHGGDDESRLRTLLKHVPAEFFPFDWSHKRKSFLRLLRTLWRGQYRLVVMEGTGVAGGLALLVGRLLGGAAFVVSSGDAIAPFMGRQRLLLKPLFGLYERMLYRWSAGVIGWTPYLVGRALSFGAPRAMTAAGWAPFARTPAELASARTRIRGKLGIGTDELVVGIAGSLAWTKRGGYCYGSELVRAIARVKRFDARALIVGDGDGRARLEKLAGEDLGRRVMMTGRVPRHRLPDYLAAMDVASLPQSVDGVGSFRYTTKLSEYLAAGLPVVTGQIPLSYDLNDGWLWRLPGPNPWDERYIQGLAEWISRLTAADLAAKRSRVPRELPEFNRDRQIERVTAFLGDLLAEKSGNGCR